MLVNFLSVEAKGFLSIGEARLILNDQGMVYVTGKNNSPGNQDSNGAGKSTLFEAIMYALTGTTLRGTKDVVNIYWKGYAEVTLGLSVDGINYKIMRTRNHPEYGNNLKIWRDGEDISGDKLKKSEQILKNEIGQLTSSLISSVIVLGQGLPNRFTGLTPLGRKDRLEELSQSSEFVDEIKSRIGNFKDLYHSKNSKNDIEIAKRETSINNYKSQIINLSKKLEEIENSEKNIDSMKKELSELNNKLKQTKESQSQISDLRNTLSENLANINSTIQIKRNQQQSESRELSRLVEEVSNLQNKICPTCHQPIYSQDSLAELTEERNRRAQEIKNNRVVLDNDINTLNSKSGIVSEKIAVLDERYRNAQSNINDLQRSASEISSDINRLSVTSQDIEKEMLLYSTKVEDESKQLRELASNKSTYDLKIGILDFLDKKSSKEFRSFMLIGVVQYINTKLDYYSNKLFGNSSLELVLDGNKIFIRYDGRQYENLSGGERQRADLAMQFSLRDMLINSLGFNCNLLVIDEGFDNLDEAGVNSLIEVINSMSEIDSVFTITHHTLSIPFDKTIIVIKDINKVSSVYEEV